MNDVSTGLQEWKEDLHHLARELPARHKNLFFQIKPTEFEKSIVQLDTSLSSLSDHEIIVHLASIVASVGDSHTRLSVDQASPIFRTYPLKLYSFQDGLCVVETTAEHSSLLGATLEQIGERPIQNVVHTVKSMIPHENESQLRMALPDHVVTPGILHTFRILSDMNEGLFTFTNADPFQVTFSPIPRHRSTSWIGFSARAKASVPLYLKHPNKHYWFDYLEKDQIVYFQYNSCQNMQEQTFADFSDELFGFIESNLVERLVFDMRNNGGGNSSIAEPFLSRIEKSPDLNRKGHLFVTIGRRTFSSAILNAMRLRKETAAILAGEATGGKPNHYGEVLNFKLPNSQLEVYYSTKHRVTSEQDLRSIFPDISIELSSPDYFSGRDPVLERIATI